MLVNWIVCEVFSGGFVNDATTIVAVPEPLRNGIGTPVLLDAARLDILGRTRRLQLLDLLRDMGTGRHMIHHEANECMIQILETRWRDGRILGAFSTWKMSTASALKVDLATLRATDLKDLASDGNVSRVDQTFFARRIELHAKRIITWVIRRGQRR